MNQRLHSADLLDMAIEAAARLGYRIREDALGGFPGGACELKGQKWLFLDPSQATCDRLDLVLCALAADPGTVALDLPHPLVGVLRNLRAA